ncbi:MAG: sensor domain-containing diguanylate cyclase [Thermoanaerobaculia bacterium]|nr:sensor domain-containing diguanylate cyclase [Thermoanaerobaculia bacterium]
MATRKKSSAATPGKRSSGSPGAGARGRKPGPDEADLAVLNEIARVASLDLELQPTLQRITDALARHFDWDTVACVLVEQERNRFVCMALTSRLAMVPAIGVHHPLGTGIIGEVAKRGRAVLLRDVRRSKRYVAWSAEVRSELCVPVRHHGRVVAALNIESRRLGAFDGQKVLLETIAEQISGAIANARLFEQVRARAAQLEMIGEISRLALDAGELSELLERVVGFVQRNFRLTATAILLLDERGERFEIAARAGNAPQNERIGASFPLVGVVGRAMRTGTSLLVSDVRSDPEYVMLHPEVVAELVVPFRFREKVLGALNLESDDSEVFSEETVAFLQALASQIAGGIHMARVNRRLAETNRLVEERTREVEQVNQELHLSNQVLQQLSTHDGLTGVANRRQFDEILLVEWRRAARVEGPIALVMVDIDQFKAFNDTYGHQAGDDALKEVAYALQDSVQRAGEVTSRYGGDEFAIILPGMHIDEAARLAEDLRQAVEGRKIRHASSSVSRYVTLSLGVASLQAARAGSAAELVAAADRALYSAKFAGRNRVEVEKDRGPDRRLSVIGGGKVE